MLTELFTLGRIMMGGGKENEYDERLITNNMGAGSKQCDVVPDMPTP
jgi:hypothetical protein